MAPVEHFSTCRAVDRSIRPARKLSRNECTTSTRKARRCSSTQSGACRKWPRISYKNGFKNEDLKLLVPHQANLRIIRATQERLGVDDSKVMVNIDRYGNTTAGTIPLGLRDAVEQGRLHKGDLVLIVTVGAGYTTGGMLLRWAY